MILFPAPVFGPVHSRRLGISLGINLLPADRKVCSFDCIYCECGFRRDSASAVKTPLPSREMTRAELRQTLERMRTEGQRPDVITFAGNGEPTLHPDFLGVMTDVVALRDEFAPEARVCVLSNATTLDRPDVVDALCLADEAILKIDAGRPDVVRMLDVPNRADYSTSAVASQIVSLRERLGHRLAIQTMFAAWTDADGAEHDNTCEEDLAPWLLTLSEIFPPRVMIYTIDRETPLSTMRKALREALDGIAEVVRGMGIADVSVSY